METVYKNILDEVYRYLPKGVSYHQEEAYGHSPEIKLLQQRCRQAEVEHSEWNKVLGCLEQNLQPGQIVVDWSVLHTLDRCYRLSVLLENTSLVQKILVVSLSVICPYYGCYLSERDVTMGKDGNPAYSNHRVSFDLNGLEPVLETVQACINGAFPHRLLPCDIAQKIVPGIGLESTPEGEVTVFKAIFTEHFI